MKKSALVLTTVGITMLLSSCSYDKDPFADFKKEAQDAYNTYYANNPTVEKAPLFYFDIETLRSALVRDEHTVSFLGQFKLTDFTFSESKKYFADLGNLPIHIEDKNNDGQFDNFTLADFVKTSDTGETIFDVKTFVNNLPLVLHEKLPTGEIATYSMLSKDGTIHDTSNAKAYNPDFFYLSDLKINIPELSQYSDSLLDFTNKDVCILRKDLYQIISNISEGKVNETVEKFFSIPELLNGLYQRTKELDSLDSMPTSLTIPGYHYSNFDEKSKREVVVGPNSLIFDMLQVFENKNLTKEKQHSFIQDVQNIYIEDGVKTISLYAFNGERDNDATPSKSNIKNVYLPSSLQEVQFNAFSNLDLDNLYIDKTYAIDNEGNKREAPFKCTDFGDVNLNIGVGNDTINLDVTGSFSHTNINKVNFEDYDNENLIVFPYSSTINLSKPGATDNHINIYSSNDDGTPNLDKSKNLSEALSKYDVVNPFYQVILTSDNNKKYKIDSNLTTIDSGKTLYLPASIYSNNINETRLLSSHVSSAEAKTTDALLTMKLTDDLTIKNGGKLIVGSQIGFTNNSSGVNIGGFSAIDLNGHNIIVENGGELISNGYIFDSSTKKKGHIDLSSGASLTTGITVNEYKGLNDVIYKAENNITPIDSYSLNALLTSVNIKAGATVNGILDYLDEGFNKTQFIKFVSNTENALFQLKSGELVLNKSKISNKSVDNLVAINNVSFLSDEKLADNNAFTAALSSANSNFPIANSTFEIELDEVENHANIIIPENTKFNVNSLTLFNNSCFASTAASSVQIHNAIALDSKAQKVILTGDYSLETNVFNLLKDMIKKYDGKLITNSIVESFDEKTSIRKTLHLEAFVGSSRDNFSKKIIKTNDGYYYEFSNSNESGSLLSNSDKVLASYNNKQSTWHNGDSDTLIDKNTLIDSYSTIDKSYILNNSNSNIDWLAIENKPQSDGTFVSNDKKFIKPYKQSSLIEGDFIKNTPVNNSIFISKNSRDKFININYDGQNNWINVEAFDNYRVLKIIDGNTQKNDYIAFTDGSYKTGFDYDVSKHIVTNKADSKSYAFTTNNELVHIELNSLNWANKSINGANKLIFLTQNEAWCNVSELHNGLSKYTEKNGDYFYYFYINDEWYQSVNGETANKYNKLANMSFGVLNKPKTFNGSKTKFVMKSGDNVNEKYEFILPQDLINIRKEDFEDLWPQNTNTDHLYAYRHIVKSDGSKWLFFKDTKTNKITLKKFEFAPGFIPQQPNKSDTSLITKFNFITYKVIFEGESSPRMLYILTDASDSNNAIYAGNMSQDESGNFTDDYLAIAIFTLENPINYLTK